MSFPTGWTQKKKLTINHANIGSTLTGFPVNVHGKVCAEGPF